MSPEPVLLEAKEEQAGQQQTEAKPDRRVGTTGHRDLRNRHFFCSKSPDHFTAGILESVGQSDRHSERDMQSLGVTGLQAP